MNDMKKLIISDLDGTLIRNDKSLSERTKRAVTEVRSKGYPFIIATARPERVVEKFCKGMDYDVLISLNGACIKVRQHLLKTESEISEKVEKVHVPLSESMSASDFVEIKVEGSIPHAEFVRIINALEKPCEESDNPESKETHDKIISVETSQGIFANTIIPEWDIEEVTDLASQLQDVLIYKILVAGRDHEFKSVRNLDVEKYLSFDELGNEIQSVLGDQMYSSVIDGWLYQIMNKKATKWHGIEKLLELLNATPDQVLYFGDDNDDIECVKNAGLGISMAEAIPRVKDVADLIIGSNEDDAVAAYLEALSQ